MLSSAISNVFNDEIAPGAIIQRTTIDAAEAPLVPVQFGGGSQLNGNGLEFNLIPAAGMPQQAIDGFTAAAAEWSSLLTDDILVNINIDFTTLGPGILGSASSTTESMTLTTFRNSLTADATSVSDATATANLPAGSTFSIYTSDPNNGTPGNPIIDNNGTGNNSVLDINTSTSKAIGVRAAGDAAVDASITFSDQFTWDFDRSNGISPGAFDFIGVAAHEIGHALGFRSGVDAVDQTSGSGPSAPLNLDNFRVSTALDMFRYSAGSISNGADIDMRADTDVKFFSIDGGTTQITTFSTGVFNGDGSQASHWKDNLGIGLMDPTAAPGEFADITNFDIQGMDVIGWDLDTTGTGSIFGTKFEDLNLNGFRDAGEPGLPGWTIFIDENGNGVFDSLSDGVEPDDFAPGTDLTNVNPNVTLSEVTDAGAPTGSTVTAVNGAFPSTGVRNICRHIWELGAEQQYRLADRLQCQCVLRQHRRDL